MKINKGMIPPNGYHFPIAEGVRLNAATYDLLIEFDDGTYGVINSNVENTKRYSDWRRSQGC